MEGTATPHVAIVSSPGIGHIAPLLLLARRLVTLHYLDVTFFLTATPDYSPPAAQALLVDSLLDLPSPSSARLHVIHLPPVDISNLVPPSAQIVTRLAVTVKDSLPSLKSAIAALSPRPTVLLVDLFGTDGFDVADELGLSKYVYITSTAALLALTLHSPALDRDVEGEFVDLREPVRVPGCRPVAVEDLVDPMLDRKDDSYRWYLHHATRYREADGILVNTCEGMEPGTLKALRTERWLESVSVPPVYPVGPLVRSPERVGIGWLDAQPRRSVIFVSFGSGGALSTEQTMEVAAGLEESGYRFLWVFRPPSGRKDSAYFREEGVEGWPAYLPEGFLDRTKNTGLLVPSWAPQVAVLAHEAVGAFLTHGGWNSVSESIISRVPMVVWPLYAEQKMNAAMVAEQLKVGVRVRKTGLDLVVVGRKVVERAVRMVMEGKVGKETRKNVEEMREVVVTALHEGGSSYRSLADVVGMWQRRSHGL